MREVVVTCPAISALLASTPARVKYDPAIDEIRMLPFALTIWAPDISKRCRVEAGPKLCRVRFEVVRAFELVTDTLLIEGVVIGRVRKFKKPAIVFKSIKFKAAAPNSSGGKFPWSIPPAWS
jgi:hypothetical protein